MCKTNCYLSSLAKCSFTQNRNIINDFVLKAKIRERVKKYFEIPTVTKLEEEIRAQLSFSVQSNLAARKMIPKENFWRLSFATDLILFFSKYTAVSVKRDCIYSIKLGFSLHCSFVFKWLLGFYSKGCLIVFF